MNPEQMRFDSLERACLEPPDIDEILPYDDWWFMLEDIKYDEFMEGRLNV